MQKLEVIGLNLFLNHGLGSDLLFEDPNEPVNTEQEGGKEVFLVGRSKTLNSDQPLDFDSNELVQIRNTLEQILHDFVTLQEGVEQKVEQWSLN